MRGGWVTSEWEWCLEELIYRQPIPSPCSNTQRQGTAVITKTPHTLIPLQTLYTKTVHHHTDTSNTVTTTPHTDTSVQRQPSQKHLTVRYTSSNTDILPSLTEIIYTETIHITHRYLFPHATRQPATSQKFFRNTPQPPHKRCFIQRLSTSHTNLSPCTHLIEIFSHR